MKSKLTLLFFIATAFANQLNANQAIITGTVSLSDKIKLNKITVQALNTENKIVTKTTTNTQGKFTLKKLENNTSYIIQ